MAARTAAPGVAMAAHSNDSSTPPTAIRTRKGARHSGAWKPKTQTAPRAPAASTAPDTARTAKLFQSNPLAGRKDIVFGGRLAGDRAIAPLTALEFGDRRLQVVGAVVRPVDGLEDQFRVGALPEQEIGDPLFAAGADDQVGSGRRRGREVGLEQGLVEVAGAGQPVLDSLGEGPGGVDDVGLSAVVERHLQVEPMIAGGAGLGAFDDLQDVRVEPGAPADDAHPDPLALEAVDVALEIGLEQTHQLGHLPRGTAPVLGGEAEYR